MIDTAAVYGLGHTVVAGGRSAAQIEGSLPAATFRLTDPRYIEMNQLLEQHPAEAQSLSK